MLRARANAGARARRVVLITKEETMTGILHMFNGAIGTANASYRPRQPVSRLGLFLERRRERARILRDCDRLMDLPDHILRDIGLNRYRVAAERQRVRNQLFWGIGQ